MDISVLSRYISMHFQAFFLRWIVLTIHFSSVHELVPGFLFKSLIPFFVSDRRFGSVS